ncbi:MAG: putative rane protein [Gemmatimonadetes bacterium]|nr:putative rane protein [Gemmatimonadota bacterium]
MKPTVPHLAALALGLAALAACTQVPPALTPPVADPPLQAVVSITEGWDGVQATVQRYERKGAYSPWQAVGQPMRAVVGRSGLGWGEGLYEAPGGTGPVKREGDGRAPAGVFRLGTAFGYLPADSLPWIRIAYRQSTAESQCVDDPASRAYNSLVDLRNVARPDWTSHEEMLRPDSLYRLGVFVDHNVRPASAGRGSCIFLHVWAGPTVGTSGCTAFAPAALEEVVRWLDPTRRAVLVQLPRAEYDRMRQAWSLP